MRWELKLSILFVAIGITLIGIYCLAAFWGYLMPALEVFADRHPTATKFAPLLSPVFIVFGVIFSVFAKKSKSS